jgi:hypothetical protein
MACQIKMSRLGLNKADDPSPFSPFSSPFLWVGKRSSLDKIFVGAIIIIEKRRVIKAVRDKAQ